MTQAKPLHSQWFEYAERDLGVAQFLFKNYLPTPYENICYQCQQAAEKALKALYLFLQIPGGIPRTHDLSLLMDQMRKRVEIDDLLYDMADELTPYGTASRYPGDLFYEADGTRKALQASEMIVAWVKQRIE